MLLMNCVFVDLIWGKKTYYNMSNFVLLSNFSLFRKQQDSVDNIMNNSLCR